MTRIVAVSAGLSTPSSTRLLADRLAAAVRDELDGAVRDELDGVVDGVVDGVGDGVVDGAADGVVHTVELREYAHEITDHLLTGFPGERLRAVLDRVAEADGLVLVTPTFTASYSGLFKSFVDVLEPESMHGKPVLIGATGGTERHSLVLDHALRPLLAYLRAVVVPTGVYAATSDWGSDSDLGGRITRAARELADTITRHPPIATTDPFTDPVPFEQLLRDR